MDRVEVEVAAFPRRDERELVADLDGRDRVEILGDRDVRLAARIERDEQEAARGQALLAQLLEAEDDRRRVPIMVDARGEHPARAYLEQDASKNEVRDREVDQDAADVDERRDERRRRARGVGAELCAARTAASRRRASRTARSR